MSYYSRLGRVVVSYDSTQNSWHCPCAKTKRSCPHKYIAKWHLFQTNPSLFKRVRSTDVEAGLDTGSPKPEEEDVGDVNYPSEDQEMLKRMVQYILKHKRIPAVLDEEVLHPVAHEPKRHLIPEEMLCHHCPGNVPLSDPVLITNRAKILFSTHIVQGR